MLQTFEKAMAYNPCDSELLLEYGQQLEGEEAAVQYSKAKK